jgi:hypothetical protein
MLDYSNVRLFAPKKKPVVDSEETSVRFSYYPNVDQPTEEEKERWKKEDEERHERERKYLHEFELSSCKFVKKMSDFTDIEIKYWKQCLDENFISGVGDDVVDLFDKGNSDIYNEEIKVMIWFWSHDNQVDILYDMNAWPGDYELGSVFMNGAIVLENSGQIITETEVTSEDLIERMDSFAHIRIQTCTEELNYDNDYPAHENCRRIKTKFDEICDNNPAYNPTNIKITTWDPLDFQ